MRIEHWVSEQGERYPKFYAFTAQALDEEDTPTMRHSYFIKDGPQWPNLGYRILHGPFVNEEKAGDFARERTNESIARLRADKALEPTP